MGALRRQQGGVAVIISIVVALIIVGVLGFLLIQRLAVREADPTPQEPTSTPTTTYRSAAYGISFDHPADWSVEQITDERSASWPLSYLAITNASGTRVAQFGTLGALGLSCGEGRQAFDITTLASAEATISGTLARGFSYSIVKGADDGYAIAYGLTREASTDGTISQPCPDQYLSSRYAVPLSEDTADHFVFGRWLPTGEDYKVDGVVAFDSFDKATAYAEGDEFAQVRAMIRSLRLEGDQ